LTPNKYKAKHKIRRTTLWPSKRCARCMRSWAKAWENVRFWQSINRGAEAIVNPLSTTVIAYIIKNWGIMFGTIAHGGLNESLVGYIIYCQNRRQNLWDGVLEPVFHPCPTW
jgi:hypothetical protein